MTVLFLEPQFKVEWMAELGERGVFMRQHQWLDETQRILLVVDDHGLEGERFVWVKDVWPAAVRETYSSIGSAQKRLREVARRWAHVTFSHHRRGELILEGLRSSKLVISGWPEVASGDGRELIGELAGFMLLSESEIIWCAHPREIFPGGEWKIDESDEPPSRAYLKLWEWGWRTSSRPEAGMTVLDLASHPGGWTWVLLKAGLRVRAFDRAPFEAEFIESVGDDGAKRLTFTRADIFRCTPKEVGTCDWVFCDVIAEPEKTVLLLADWYQNSSSGLCFTIKFKGQDGPRMLAILRDLQKMPDLQVQHLAVNKHEMTVWRAPLSHFEAFSQS